MSVVTRNLKARIGALSRQRPADDPELLAARRDLKALRLAEHIDATVNTAPPLTDSQRGILAARLVGA